MYVIGRYKAAQALPHLCYERNTVMENTQVKMEAWIGPGHGVKHLLVKLDCYKLV